MGLTHVWVRTPELPEQQFANGVRDCQRLAKGIPGMIAGFDGTGSAIFAPDHIVFNGASPASCEPFEFRRVEFDLRGRSEVFSFCKTGGLPYDRMVKAALIVLKHHLADGIRVGSDEPQEKWSEACDWVASELTYGGDFRLTL